MESSSEGTHEQLLSTSDVYKNFYEKQIKKRMTFIVYRILINVLLLVSPLIIVFRLIKKKRILIVSKKIFIFFKKKYKKTLIWFHGASVGELLSVVPLIEFLEKNKKLIKYL